MATVASKIPSGAGSQKAICAHSLSNPCREALRCCKNAGINCGAGGAAAPLWSLVDYLRLLADSGKLLRPWQAVLCPFSCSAQEFGGSFLFLMEIGGSVLRSLKRHSWQERQSQFLEKAIMLITGSRNSLFYGT